MPNVYLLPVCTVYPAGLVDAEPAVIMTSCCRGVPCCYNDHLSQGRTLVGGTSCRPNDHELQGVCPAGLGDADYRACLVTTCCRCGCSTGLVDIVHA